MNLKKITELAFIDELKKIAEAVIVYQCEECGHKIEVGEEEEPDSCPMCGGKMELAEVEQ